ncbi:MAG: fibronectin type III domain-containing protein [Gemmatimonadetes bacterium]|nr:fibronectin type III domain-containing protein [Gemmatimonadota bacterium]
MSAAELRALIERVTAAIAAAAAADAALRQEHAAKDQTLVALKDVMRANLWYTEVDVRGQPERLSGLGWGGRPGATDAESPGEVRDLSVAAQTDTSVVLAWRPPAEGGPVASYTVQRRKPGGAWEDVATAVDNDCLLADQPRGIEFDLRVIAVNKAGAGQPTRTVTVVL